ncbi:MAG: carbohydrate-binding DOMON domain-containing protein, partial [Myxococcota bacterium]
MRPMSACALACATLFMVSAASADTITLKDPTGDDKGPGNYIYPTDSAYKRGSFDLTSVKLEEKGDKVVVTVTVNSKIEDPWGSAKWDGQGFSLQMAFIFIDTDHKAGSGYKSALPGLNVNFAETSRWEKVLLVSPQGTRRLSAEVAAKAKRWKKDIVIPTRVRVRGRSLVATYKAADVGKLSPSFGYQAIMQSNEGFPDKGDLLTRKVNEYNGKHRFGGGSDFNC